MPKQWAKVRTKSKAFGSKGGWTTPLRATNRILTGPFKSESEAQSFVNTLAKDGLSGFVFVSDAGQKITKLAGK
ncbi:SPOR domain-containing protein [Sphingomonas sp. MMS24-J45]|uniref:SPOR domain-containing protein n=1 Tax=Sphingomonas sp. MMS24-J45 TaxID=3238806 RepID=UPI00384EB830